MKKNIGKVIQIIGPVLDIRFEDGQLPDLLGAIEIEHEGKAATCTEDATYYTKCVRCPEVDYTKTLTKEGTKLGHSYNDRDSGR